MVAAVVVAAVVGAAVVMELRIVMAVVLVKDTSISMALLSPGTIVMSNVNGMSVTSNG